MTTSPASSAGRIVFNSDDCQIYTVNPDGSSLVQVTHVRRFCVAGQPTWSPDGSRIAFGLFTGDRVSLFTMNADGSDRRPLVDDGSGFFDVGPDYSPDGALVFFARCRPDPPGGCAIYAVNADGSGERAITGYRHGLLSGSDARPEVSPDGRSISFTRQGWKGVQDQVWVMTGGHAPHPVTQVRTWAQSAHWAPDGRSLYYFGGSPNGFGLQIFKVAAAGGHVTQLTDSPWPNGNFSVAPAPDGSLVAFVSDRESPDACCNALFVMHPNGSHQHVVLDSLQVFNPDWGPAPLRTGASDPVSRPTAEEAALFARVTALVDRREGAADARARPSAGPVER